MGSTLSALVVDSAGGLRSVAGTRAPVVDLPQGFALLPLTKCVRVDLDVDEPMADNVSYLTPALAELAKRWSAETTIAYIESETHGGTGTQVAAIWRGAEVVWGPRYTANNAADADETFILVTDPSEYAVNAALRELGVERRDAFDEYAALGLDAKRSTDDWLT